MVQKEKLEAGMILVIYLKTLTSKVGMSSTCTYLRDKKMTN